MLRAHRQAWAWQDEWFGLTMDQIRELERETQRALALKMKSQDMDERSVTNEEDEEEEEGDEEDEGEEGDEEEKEDEEEQKQRRKVEQEKVPKNRFLVGRTSSTETTGKDRPGSDGDSLKGGGRKVGGDRIEHLKKSRSNSRTTLLHTPVENLDLQIANWRMESIVNDETDESADEFYDAQDNIEETSGPESAQMDGESVDETDKTTSRSTTANKKTTTDTSTSSPLPEPCPTSVLVFVLHGGHVLDSGSDLSSKKSDLSTFRSTFEQLLRLNCAGLLGRIHFRLVACPPICVPSLQMLSKLAASTSGHVASSSFVSSLTSAAAAAVSSSTAGTTSHPFSSFIPSFSTNTAELDRQLNETRHAQENIPLQCLPLFAVSSHEYVQNLQQVCRTLQKQYSEFRHTEEGLHFNGQVLMIGDFLGGVLAYDLLCNLSPACGRSATMITSSTKYSSELNLADSSPSSLLLDRTFAAELHGTCARPNSASACLTPQPRISISDSSDIEADNAAAPILRPHYSTMSVHAVANLFGRKIKSTSGSGVGAGAHVSQPVVDSSSSVLLSLPFQVHELYLFGSPLALVLSFRKLLADDFSSSASAVSAASFSSVLVRPRCKQVYNLLHPTDVTALRLEPLLWPPMHSVPALNVLKYSKQTFARCQQSVRLSDCLQTHFSNGREMANFEIRCSDPTTHSRRMSESSLLSNAESAASNSQMLTKSVCK